MLVALVAIVTLAAAPQALAATASYDHVVIVLMENHSRDEIKPAQAPFITSFGAQDTDFRAITHPSLPNYLALTSGFTQGCDNDRCPPASLRVANIFAQLGSDARSLAESMPHNCTLVDARPYVAHHNPQVYYVNSPCASQDEPLGDSPDLSARFTFVTPNLNHDMHDGSVAAGDDWFRGFMDQVHASPEWKNDRTAVVLTFDEGSGSDQNIWLAVDSNQGQPKDISTPANLADLLATMESVLGEPVIGPGDASLLLPLFPGAGSAQPGGGGLLSNLSVTPDPATTGAMINFTLARDSQIDVTIRDAGGNLVRHLTDFGGLWSAGLDGAFWGLHGDNGDRVPAGTYRATMRAQADDGTTDVATVPIDVG